MRVLTVVGARPQFVKASAVSRALSERHDEVLVHSGQHHDPFLSAHFFEDLQIPAPTVSLDLQGARGAARLVAMVEGLHAAIEEHLPDVVMVYGDTDTTLAGALAARAANVRLAHVEAGLRSGVPSMPEEGNRIAVDHLSDVLLCPTRDAVDTLARERVRGHVEWVGDVMLDVSQHFAAHSGVLPDVAATAGRGEYYAATLHRAANVDDDGRLRAFVTGLSALERRVVLACHPRTRAALERIGVDGDHGALRLVAPLRYGDMLALVASARAVLTDSGGLQKEAFFLGVPCVTLRSETEWPETLAGGWNRLVGSDARRLRDAVAAVDAERGPRDLDQFGGGRAAGGVVAALESLVH